MRECVLKMMSWYVFLAIGINALRCQDTIFLESENPVMVSTIISSFADFLLFINDEAQKKYSKCKCKLLNRGNTFQLLS